ADHAHDGPPTMTGPLIVLEIFSVVAGYGLIAGPTLGEALRESVETVEGADGKWIVMALATCAFLAGAGGGWFLYKGQAKDPILIPPLKNKFYFDEFYAAFIAGTQDLLATLARYIDQWFIDGVLVRGLSGLAWGTGFVLRFLQFGNLQGYAFL